MPLWNLVQENKAAVIAALIRRFDPSQGSANPIYSPEGEWSDERFAQWLVAAGISEWPRLASGMLEIEGDAFRLMYPAHPAIEGCTPYAMLSASSCAPGFQSARTVAIDRACFRSDRDRQKCASQEPVQCTRVDALVHAISDGQDRALLDWRTRKSEWRRRAVAMRRWRRPTVGRCLSFTGAAVRDHDDTDIKRWKAEHSDQRQQMKACSLASITAWVCARWHAACRHPIIGSEIILRHQRQYPTYWAWRASMVEKAMLERVIESEFDGWPLHISLSPNKRTLFNFPMQSGGSEMLRLAANLLCDAGLVPSMLVHDGILLELDTDEQARHAIEIMEQAGMAVCGGLKIGVDVDQRLEGGARYRDKRPMAQKMWATVMGVLQEIGALPGTEHGG